MKRKFICINYVDKYNNKNKNIEIPLNTSHEEYNVTVFEWNRGKILSEIRELEHPTESICNIREYDDFVNFLYWLHTEIDESKEGNSINCGAYYNKLFFYLKTNANKEVMNK